MMMKSVTTCLSFSYVYIQDLFHLWSKTEAKNVYQLKKILKKNFFENYKNYNSYNYVL